MVKADFIVGIALDAVLLQLTTAFSKVECVIFIKFGIFKVSTRKECAGIKPSTGIEIQIRESKIVSFKMGKGLKEILYRLYLQGAKKAKL